MSAGVWETKNKACQNERRPSRRTNTLKQKNLAVRQQDILRSKRHFVSENLKDQHWTFKVLPTQNPLRRLPRLGETRLIRLLCFSESSPKHHGQKNDGKTNPLAFPWRLRLRRLRRRRERSPTRTRAPTVDRLDSEQQEGHPKEIQQQPAQERAP